VPVLDDVLVLAPGDVLVPGDVVVVLLAAVDVVVVCNGSYR
jgi:hypothetical protein